MSKLEFDLEQSDRIFIKLGTWRILFKKIFENWSMWNNSRENGIDNSMD